MNNYVRSADRRKKFFLKNTDSSYNSSEHLRYLIYYRYFMFFENTQVANSFRIGLIHDIVYVFLNPGFEEFTLNNI